MVWPARLKPESACRTSRGRGYAVAMRSFDRVWLLPAATVLLLVSCAPAPEAGCIEPALLTGFSVLLQEQVVPAAGLREISLEACQHGHCRTTSLSLTPGSSTMDLGCATSSPGSEPEDTSCSASASPDGSLVGYWPTSEFDTGPINVLATAPGFGPYRGTVAGVEVSSGTGSCTNSAFQTRLRIGIGGIDSPAS